AAEPYPGFEGKFFSMPPRNVVPKPLQKPHPPIWVACSNRETITLAARLGIGALTFAFVGPEDAKRWVSEYYETFRNECEPIGQAVNPNIAMVTGFMCHPDSDTAVERGLPGIQFFGYGLNHYYSTGTHVPGRFNIWDDFEARRNGENEPTGCIGSPAQVRETLLQYEEAGVDQVVFIQQGGRNRHEHICESLELFASEVLPEFKEREEARLRAKAEQLAPFIERAESRIKKIERMDPIPEVESYPVLMEKLGIPQEDRRGSGDILSSLLGAETDAQSRD
ncbi:MAG: LLM class flavin-dependent oxidoreductase, partial [Dehalococcoidia bacterium]|nr:LLM class flavin-dependent oxidoreductase [Dehalococcoidia bacterium]